MPTIQDGWKSLAEKIFDKVENVPIAQRLEMRKAFFAGVHWCYQATIEASEDEEVGMKFLEQIHDELNQFIVEMNDDWQVRN
jgi:hypothetical protein